MKPRGEKASSVRTCVGCGEGTAPAELIRIVLGPDGHVAVDLAGGTFGRGAYLHASPRCLAKARAGLSRSFRTAIEVSPSQLSEQIRNAVERRVWGLLASAVRSHQTILGRDAITSGDAESRCHLLLVAADADGARSSGVVARAIERGRAVAWGTKDTLGALGGKTKIAVIGITSPKLAVAIQRAVLMGTNVAFQAAATEDR